MQITKSQVVILAVGGEFTHNTSTEEVARMVTKTLQDDAAVRGIVVDLRDVSDMDSTGRMACIDAHAVASEFGVWFAVCVPPKFQHFFTVTLPRVVFTIYPAPEEAASAFVRWHQ